MYIYIYPIYIYIYIRRNKGRDEWGEGTKGRRNSVPSERKEDGVRTESCCSLVARYFDFFAQDRVGLHQQG
jgi:hypothetical protein